MPPCRPLIGASVGADRGLVEVDHDPLPRSQPSPDRRVLSGDGLDHLPQRLDVLGPERPQQPGELTGVRPARQPGRRDRGRVARQDEIAVAGRPAAGRQRRHQRQALLDDREPGPTLLDRQADPGSQRLADPQPAHETEEAGQPAPRAAADRLPDVGHAALQLVAHRWLNTRKIQHDEPPEGWLPITSSLPRRLVCLSALSAMRISHG